MDFYELAVLRHSCRSYDAGRPVEWEKVEKCLAAALAAPSGCNSQPWRYAVARSPKKAAAVAEATQLYGLNKYTGKAPVVIAVSEVIPAKVMRIIEENYGTQAYTQMDIGLSVAHLTLQAAELGLGTCILGVFDEARIKEVLDIPESQKVRLVVAMGYPAETRSRDLARNSFDEMVRVL